MYGRPREHAEGQSDTAPLTDVPVIRIADRFGAQLMTIIGLIIHSGRFTHSIPDTGDARHPRLHHPHRCHHRRLCAVPDVQQHPRHDRYSSGPAGRHFRHAKSFAQFRAHHLCICYGRCVRVRIGADRHPNSASRGRCHRYADQVRSRGDSDRRRARHRICKPCSFAARRSSKP